jgi:hypothetical protein
MVDLHPGVRPSREPFEKATLSNRKRYPFITFAGPIAARYPESETFPLEHDAVSEIFWNDPLNAHPAGTNLRGKIVR